MAPFFPGFLVSRFLLFQSRQEAFQDGRNRFFHALLMSLHHDLRIDRRLIRCVDASELADLPCPRLFVEIFRIPFFADRKRRIDEDLDEFGITLHCNRASPLPVGPVRRNKSSDDDVAGVSHQLRYFAHTSNIFDPVIRREPKIGVQTVPDVVAFHRLGR